VSVDAAALQKSELYSEELSISLRGGADDEIFKWFLASILFGARISQDIAKKTYKTFEKYRLLEPRSILRAGWDFLVNPVMREGGYIRYDEKTSRQILSNCETLLNEYDGSLTLLHERAADSKDLEKKLTGFYGIGPMTANIFLREMRPFWTKSDPAPAPIVKKVAAHYGIDLSTYDRKSLEFARMEAGLLRLKKSLTRASGSHGASGKK
jgi:hypothetical protein